MKIILAIVEEESTKKCMEVAQRKDIKSLKMNMIEKKKAYLPLDYPRFHDKLNLIVFC